MPEDKKPEAPRLTKSQVRKMRPMLEGIYYISHRAMIDKFKDALPDWMKKYPHRTSEDVAKSCVDLLEEAAEDE